MRTRFPQKGRPYTLFGMRRLLEEHMPNYKLISYSTNRGRFLCECRKHHGVYELRNSILFCRTISNPCPQCKEAVLRKLSKRYALSRLDVQRKLDCKYDGRYSLQEDPVNTSSVVKARCNKHRILFKMSLNNALYNGYAQCPLCKHENGRIGYSREALVWMRATIRDLGWRWVDVQHAERKGELHIKGVGYVDGYHAPSNTVLEFHGDDWHGNPKRHPASKKMFYGITAGEAYRKTMRRHVILRRKGYNLIWTWESAWKTKKNARKRNKL